MAGPNISLREVDEVNITILMDNVIDMLMASSKVAQRPISNLTSRNTTPIAEHGFSALVEVKSGDHEDTVLFDTGTSTYGVLHNLKALVMDLDDINTIVLSHGHNDHTAGLPSIIEHLGSKRMSIVLHPDARLEHKIAMPNGNEKDITAPSFKELQSDNISLVEKREPTLLANDMILVSGEIERVTDFETGFPLHYSKRNGVWEKDPLIKDDQCLIINVRGRGLVIITGCGHSGIINTIRYAQSLTNNDKVLAVLGGFHLTGGIFEKIIPPTVDELVKINPDYIMPGHCTGWTAMYQIQKAMPEAFLPNNVCTTLTLKS